MKDVVLADRGFQLNDYAADCGIEWIIPPTVSKARGISANELSDTCVIARARILVERTIGRIKNHRQLSGPRQIEDLQRLDSELRVIAICAESNRFLFVTWTSMSLICSTSRSKVGELMWKLKWQISAFLRIQ